MAEKQLEKLSNSQLKEWYINEGLSSVEIAKIVNVWPQTVRDWLRKANIPIRSRNILKPSKEQLERWYISEGKSGRKIAKIVGVEKSTILRWLKEVGISPRNHREATLVSYGKSMPSAEQLYRWYVEEKKSAKQISKITNLGQETILKYLKNLGIKIRPARESTFIQYKKEVKKPSYKQLYDWYIVQRKTPKETGEILGVSSSAIRTWLKEENILLRVGREAHGYTFKKPSRQELIDWYIKEKKSSFEIAKIVGVEPTTVRRWLRKENISIRTMSEANFARSGKLIKKPYREQLKKWYIDEMKTTVEIGNMVGVPFTTIRNWLKEYKIPKRKSKYGMKYYINCKDGHKVKSSYERYVDNWLFEKGIPHEYNGLLPGSKYKYDFKIDNWYVEIWGLKNIDLYDKKMSRKIQFYETHHLKRIDIFPDEVGSRTTIDKLSPLLIFSNPDRKIYVPPKVSKEDLYKWYILEEKSSPEIAKMVGVSKRLILKWLKEEGIPRRDNRDAHLAYGKKMKAISQQQLDRLREHLYQWYVVEKKSATKIGKILGLTKGSVLDRLRKVRIKLRSPQEEAFIQYKKDVKVPSESQLKMWYIDRRKSTNDIGKIVGVSSTAVSNWLRKRGISLRKGNYKKKRD